MKQRNFLLFVVGCLALIALQAWVTQHFTPKVQPPLPPSPTTTPTSNMTSPAPPTTSTVPPLERTKLGGTHQVSLATLRLTWRRSDGALTQVEWLADGTKFFPEPNGSHTSEAFPGLGGALQTQFDRVSEERTPDGIAVHFESTLGDHLSYRIPDRGHVINITWSTPRGAHLSLIHKPQDEKPIKGLGRVFTLEDKAIHAASWSEMLTDPFFSFLGVKRKELPPATTRLGMDAGLEKGHDRQTTHYFAAIWELTRMPERDQSGFHVSPNEQGKLSARLYLGPKETQHLLAFGSAYGQVVDFGFFGQVAKLFFWILRSIHSVIGNWGWAIIIFTLFIRLILWHLNSKMIMSSLRMKDFEPHQKIIQAKYEKFGKDMTKKAEMQKELMELYKKNSHNPLGGCLPAILQIPVFMALWSMLSAVYELRHAPFVGWLTDLSAKDPYYILPVLMGASMFAQQAVTPAMGDPTQRKMMLVLMPVMFTFFFAQTPSGLCLYYFMFNLIGIFQTWWVKRSYTPQPVKI